MLYAKSGRQNAPGPGTGWRAGWVERATLAREPLHRLNVPPTA
ncbi:hypothetical protein [Nonomuraea sp. KM90]